MYRVFLIMLFTLTLTVGGCDQSFFEDPGLSPSDDDDDDDGGGPGSKAWADDDVSCSGDASCALGEVCIDHVCQMQRCADGPYSSELPVPDGFRFSTDRDLVLADESPWNGTYWADGYPVSGGAIDYSMSWPADSPIVDVTGGRLLEVGTEAVARAQQNSPVVIVGADTELALGFAPIALAAGDTDGERDGIDELIALSANGILSVCHVAIGSCDTWQIDADGIDVATGDVDGDGLDEVLLLVSFDGDEVLVAMNVEPDADESTQSVLSWANAELIRIDAGDLNGDGVDEIVGLEDDAGWFDWLLGESNDRVTIYSLIGEDISLVGGADTSPESIDLALGDIDGDDADEMLLLRGDNKVQVLTGDGVLAGGTDWALLSTTDITVTASPQRIASVDFDGDSPVARLVDGPSLVPGRVVPTTLIYYPPYDGEHSNGVSSIFAGQIESVSETYSDSVSLSVGIEVGVGASFMDIFGAKLSSKLQTKITQTHGEAFKERIGFRFTSEPDPELFGNSYGVIFLSVGCFHGYTYRFDDPSGLVGDNGEEFVALMPLEGTTTVWSTPRYNAMAREVGGMPLVEVPRVLGQPSSYPSSPSLPDGSPIPSSDLVFPDPPQFLVSDVGTLGWWLAAEEQETNSFAMDTQLDINAAVTVAGVTFGTDVGAGWGEGYSVSVGSEFFFGGGVPSIPDNPNTPEDEYAEYRFGFSPVVYRKHYADIEGNDAAMYVLDYTVGF